MGSNLGDREEHLRQAIIDLEAIAGCNGVVMASVYETAPMGPQDQPDYLNSVCVFECTLKPQALLREMKRIEAEHGRTQLSRRWGARSLDLDILLFGRQQIDTENLIIPHVGIAERSFVLWPLAELDPELQIPGLENLSILKERCEKYGIKRYADL